MRGAVVAVLSAAAALLFAGWPARDASAVVMRHDVDPALFEVAESAFPFVFPLVEIDGAVGCAATLVTPRWAVTAAHCTALLEARTAAGVPPIVEINGAARAIDRVAPHPGFGAMRVELTDTGGVGAIETEDLDLTRDIALVRLDAAVDISEIPAPGPSRVGEIALLPGWGVAGDGETGVRRDGPRQTRALRLVTNRVETVEEHILWFLFDAPGSGGETAREGVPGPGDSGGPALAADGDGGWRIIGVSSHGSYPPLRALNERTEGRYGWRDAFIRIDAHSAWIAETILSGD